MDKPLLSICIPTYSRAHFLRECLDSILGQMQDPEIFSRVEIVISDNASTDNTRELVSEYSAKYPNIKYSRNASNLGYDRNVSAVLSMGRGQFLWLMSDDEALLSGSISFLLPLLEKNPDVGYFCVDQEEQGPEFERFADGNAWLGKLGLKGGLVSQNIFNRDFLPKDLNKYFGNWWLHYSVALEILAKHPGILVKRLFLKTEPRPVVWARGGLGFTTYNCLNKIVRGLSEYGYSQKILNKILQGMAKGLPKNIASAKIRDLKISPDGLKVLFQEYKSYPFWLLAGLLVYLTPNFVLKIFKRA